MTTKVKICGLKTAAALEAAIAAGADYIGLVFYPPSPRSVSVDAAAGLARLARGRAKVVVLLVDPDEALLDEVVAAVDPDLIQLHGRETPERLRAIRARWGRPVMKAVSVRSGEDVLRAFEFEGAADLILFDAKAPEGMAGALPGGNGIPFDWGLLSGVKNRLAYMLSGGLSPDNVAEAIRMTGAPVVDVSSGVERSPGEKDPALIRRFVAAVRDAAHELSEPAGQRG
jgi:phosphoribosylanthranilate isomerase